MERQFLVRGLPQSVHRDAWWVGSDDGGTPQGTEAGGAGGRRHLAALAALVLLGDFLFYRHTLGLSLALFVVAVFAAATQFRAGGRRRAGPAALLFVSLLPVVEYVQPISVAFLALGLLTALAWTRLGPAAPAVILQGALRLVAAMPVSAPKAVGGHLRRLPSAGGCTPARNWLRAWGFPLGGAIVLLTLLSGANPVLAEWIDAIIRFHPDLGVLLRRLLFWLGLALMLWPALDPAPLTVPPSAPSALVHATLPGLNARSVANALVVFNGVIGVQTLLDASFLWAGAALPDGMTYARYAHRGAYPLLATALLAGGFALAARPWLEERRALMPLMALWLGQNVLLCLSAAYRLKIYVDAFGLTYLRVHAAIWMVLVAIGLVLTGWQIWRRRPNRWLVARTAALGFGTLYLCAFVNFAAIIAAHNLARTGQGDRDYLCTLGDMAASELLAGAADLPCSIQRPTIAGWRDWGFRKWRVSRYLEAATPGGAGS